MVAIQCCKLLRMHQIAPSFQKFSGGDSPKPRLVFRPRRQARRAINSNSSFHLEIKISRKYNYQGILGRWNTAWGEYYRSCNSAEQVSQHKMAALGAYQQVTELLILSHLEAVFRNLGWVQWVVQHYRTGLSTWNGRVRRLSTAYQQDAGLRILYFMENTITNL